MKRSETLTACALFAGFAGAAATVAAIVALATPCADLASQACRDQTRGKVAVMLAGLSTIAAGGLAIGAADVARTARRRV